MKKIRINLFIICLLGVLAEVCAQESTWREMPYFLKGYEKQYKKSPKEAALSWFKDARFGLFVHWGPASLYGQGEWVMYNNRIPIKEYEQKAREFKGDKFNAQDYVNLALDANMKYITFVIKHHDGFALWDSKASDYNSVKYPSGRDFLKELSIACKKAGLGLFIILLGWIGIILTIFLIRCMTRHVLIMRRLRKNINILSRKTLNII